MVNIGSTIPYALEAKVHKPISFENTEAYRWSGNPRDEKEFEELNRPARGGAKIDWLHRVAVDARTSSKRIRAAAAGYEPGKEYPRDQLAGDPVKGGLFGAQPSLTDLDENGDLRMQVDFRTVYASVLEDWMGVDAAGVLGGSFEKLKVLA